MMKGAESAKISYLFECSFIPIQKYGLSFLKLGGKTAQHVLDIAKTTCKMNNGTHSRKHKRINVLQNNST